MIRRFIATILLLASLPLAADSCDTEGVCLTVEKNAGDVFLLANNLNAYPVKLWVDVDLENMRANTDLPRTIVLQAQSHSTVATLSVRDPHERSRFNPVFKWRKVTDHWQNCIQDYLCIQVELEEDRFTFYMQNTIQAPLTIAFEDKGFKNLKSSVTFPHVQSCPAKQRCRLFTAELIEDFGGWHYPHAIRAKKGYLNVHPEEDFVYQLPYQLGTRHKVGQGYNGSFSHRGEYAIDWNMPEGTPVYAARGGKVIEVVDNYSVGGVRRALQDRANNIKILHDDKSVGAYAHLQKNGALVQVGDTVSQGQKIGLSGNTGYSSGPHLHFEVYGIDEWLKEVTFPIRFAVGGSPPRELEEGKFYTAVATRTYLKIRDLLSGQGLSASKSAVYTE